MKIFISSVIAGFEAERESAALAIESLGHQVVRAEDFPASPSSPQQACLQGVRASDLVVLILGERYGVRQESDLSATHEECLEARDSKPLLVFVQGGIDFENPDFVEEVTTWAGGNFTGRFETPSELQREVTRAIHNFELSSAAGAFDEDEVARRAEAVLPEQRSGVIREAALHVVVAGGPTQQILRPAQLDDEELRSDIHQEALFGDTPVLDPSEGTDVKVEGERLVLPQQSREVTVDQLGTISISGPARTELPGDRMGLSAIIEEDLQDRIQKATRFTASLLDYIDSTHRLTDVVVIAAVAGRSGLGWQTKAESESASGGIHVNPTSPDPAIAALQPPSRRRPALTFQAQEVAEDLTVLLRREIRGG